MNRTVVTARCNWAAGCLIGLMPLLAHAALHFYATAPAGWSDKWAPDMLFITISNAGFAAVSIFVRSGFSKHPFRELSPLMILVWALLLLCFAGASMLYGVDVIGYGNGRTIPVAGALILCSCFCSYNFEMAMVEIE